MLKSEVGDGDQPQDPAGWRGTGQAWASPHPKWSLWWETMQVANGWGLQAVSLAYRLLLALAVLQDTFPDLQEGTGDPSESPCLPRASSGPGRGWLASAVSGIGVVVDGGKPGGWAPVPDKR